MGTKTPQERWAEQRAEWGHEAQGITEEHVLAALRNMTPGSFARVTTISRTAAKDALGLETRGLRPFCRWQYIHERVRRILQESRLVLRHPHREEWRYYSYEEQESERVARVEKENRHV